MFTFPKRIYGQVVAMAIALFVVCLSSGSGAAWFQLPNLGVNWLESVDRGDHVLQLS